MATLVVTEPTNSDIHSPDGYTFDVTNDFTVYNLKEYLNGNLIHEYGESVGFSSGTMTLTTWKTNANYTIVGAGAAYYCTGRTESGGGGDLITSNTVSFTFDTEKASGPTPSDNAVDVSQNLNNLSIYGALYKYSYDSLCIIDALPTTVKFYMGTESDNLSLRGEYGGGTFRSNLPFTISCPFLLYGTTYYWRVDFYYENLHDGTSPTITGDVWSFTVEYELPGKPTNPAPANLSSGIVLSYSTLSWDKG